MNQGRVRYPHRRRALVAALATSCWLIPLAWAPPANANKLLSPAQEQRLQGIFRQSERFEHEGDPVKAYLSLREAQRLEQIFTSNVAGDEGLSTRRLNHLVTTLIRRDDGWVMRILHSKQVTLGDKLNLIHALEQDVLLNYPGAPSDGLLSGYEE